MLETGNVPDDGSDRESDGTWREGQVAAGLPEGRRRFFSMQFTSTARGARSARRTAVRHLEEWGFPPAEDVSCTVALVVAELAANAVRHGGAHGRNFLLSVIHEVDVRHIRVEVSDTSPELPPLAPAGAADDEESGRGLVLVGVLAARWGADPRPPAGKTVWAECLVGPPVRTRETADQVRAEGGGVVAVCAPGGWVAAGDVVPPPC